MDRFTGGWDRGELIVLGARPSEGKTSLACRIAEGVAERGGTVLFFSLETKAMGIVERLLHGRARFPLSASNTGAITGGDAGKLLEAAAWFDSLKIYIDDSRGLTPEQISARAERVKFEAGPLDLVIIDYLQLMNVPPDIRRCGLREAVTFLTNQCQILPERLDCPLLLLSQLTRDCERENRRPRLDDLRESGAIEQDASQVWLIHRPEGIGKADPGIREIIVAKNKTGPTGQVHLQYGPVFMRFECLDTALDPWERPAPDEEGINF
ncbi:MAG TPA: DnaB-like helicase C-terminal domain-containing protein [bacterium]|nr:DnaB-like helicase C-terminal domain-containing protein [bacterium]